MEPTQQLTLQAFIGPVQMRLSADEIEHCIASLEEQCSGAVIAHSSGGLYRVVGASMGHKDGESFWQLDYRPIDHPEAMPRYRFKHSRVLHEFFTGKFIPQNEKAHVLFNQIPKVL